MTSAKRRENFVHIENALKECHAICEHEHGRQRMMMAYNMALELSNDEFPNMEEYRRQFNDPMS